MRLIASGLLIFALMGFEANAQSLREIATAAARVDRSDPDAVRAIQVQLQELGYYQGPVDGIFGRQTFDAAVAAVDAVNAEVAILQEERAARLRAAAAAVQNSSDGSDGSSDLEFTNRGTAPVSAVSAGPTESVSASIDSTGSSAEIGGATTGSAGFSAVNSGGVSAATGSSEAMSVNSVFDGAVSVDATE